jgi:hypothetical protein
MKITKATVFIRANSHPFAVRDPQPQLSLFLES